MRFLILGAGSWGSALALYLATRDHAVVLWGHDANEMAQLAQSRTNPHYLQAMLPEQIQITSDLAQAFQWAGKDPIVLMVIPSHAFEEVLVNLQPYLSPTMPIMWGTKGLSPQGDLLHQLCQRIYPHHPLAVLSGPSFAAEVIKGLPTAVTIASTDPTFGDTLVQAFHSETFRIYLSQDIIGVQLGGAIKNVLAIAVGMSDGLGFGANARSALITRGLAELCRLGEKLGAKLPTMMGLSGVGDVVLTCTDNQSRNRRFGLALGQGKSAQQAQTEIGQVVEGKDNVKQVIALAQKMHVEMPICQQVLAVLYQGVTPQQAVQQLLTRAPKTE